MFVKEHLTLLPPLSMYQPHACWDLPELRSPRSSNQEFSLYLETLVRGCFPPVIRNVSPSSIKQGQLKIIFAITTWSLHLTCLLYTIYTYKYSYFSWRVPISVVPSVFTTSVVCSSSHPPIKRTSPLAILQLA